MDISRRSIFIMRARLALLAPLNSRVSTLIFSSKVNFRLICACLFAYYTGLTLFQNHYAKQKSVICCFTSPNCGPEKTRQIDVSDSRLRLTHAEPSYSSCICLFEISQVSVRQDEHDASLIYALSRPLSGLDIFI